MAPDSTGIVEMPKWSIDQCPNLQIEQFTNHFSKKYITLVMITDANKSKIPFKYHY